MYNEKIEQLIKAALADGVLTEKEKQVLFKNAQAAGIDLDEFEMVLDARLVELQKEEKERAAKSAPKSDKFGDVRKCPACGALVPALAVSCAECGYEFTGVGASSSSQTLAKQISQIQENATRKKNDATNSGKYSTKGGYDSPLRATLRAIDQAAQDEIKSLVNNFPIPNTKNDLFDMIMFLKNHGYEDKYNECIEKAKMFFPNDPMIKQLLEDANMKKKEENATMIGALCMCVAMLIGIGIFCWLAYLNDYGFWGWIGMIYGGAFAGGIAGGIIGFAVVRPILKSILKKR